MEKSGSLLGEGDAGWDELVGVFSTRQPYQNQMAGLARTTGSLQQRSRTCRSAASSKSGSKPARRESTTDFLIASGAAAVAGHLITSRGRRPRRRLDRRTRRAAAHKPEDLSGGGAGHAPNRLTAAVGGMIGIPRNSLIPRRWASGQAGRRRGMPQIRLLGRRALRNGRWRTTPSRR